MKQIKIPDDVAEWSFDRYLTEAIWPRVFWRLNADCANAALELHRSLAGKTAGELVEVTDRHHELLLSQIGIPDSVSISPTAAVMSWTAVVAVASARTV